LRQFNAPHPRHGSIEFISCGKLGVDWRHSAENAANLADIFASGRWTHDYPISVEEARQLRLPVSTEVPTEVY
jgi:hypothetical protein